MIKLLLQNRVMLQNKEISRMLPADRLLFGSSTGHPWLGNATKANVVWGLSVSDLQMGLIRAEVTSDMKENEHQTAIFY